MCVCVCVYVCACLYSLQTSGRLMELDISDGHLKVHYSERLVQLLRENRQLLAYGYAVPAKIQHTALTAMKFYRHAIVLKQVRKTCSISDSNLYENRITIQSCSYLIVLQIVLLSLVPSYS